MLPKLSASHYILWSVVDNCCEFMAVTLTAQGLDITDIIGTSLREGDHMIRFQPSPGHAATQTCVTVIRA